MEDVITQQLKKEKRRKAADEEDAKAKKLTDAIDNLGNINLSVYQQYLQWFTQFELERAKPSDLSGVFTEKKPDSTNKV